MITEITANPDNITKVLYDELEKQVDLDILVHVEQIIWNHSPIRFLKEYMKQNQYRIFNVSH